MKLEPFNFDKQHCAVPVCVCCLACGKMINVGVLDRDGPTFKAFYCTEHPPEEPRGA